VTDLLVYAVATRAPAIRAAVGAACRATGIGAQLELYGSGSLYQRLGPRHAPPLPDVVIWFGPYAASAAAADGLLQPHQPAQLADAAVHDASWRWTTLDFSTFGVVGPNVAGGLADLAAVPRLAVADPERSEVGLNLLLATLDRARQVDGDAERGWAWWQQRAAAGLFLTEDDSRAASAVGDGQASHALSLLSETAAPLTGLAPVPHAIGLASSARNVDAARRMIDWLTGEQAAAFVRLSPWQAASNGLQALLAGAPRLNLDWTSQQYSASRRRWARSGFGPRLTS
jgi:ABC-type Fe3+ transport system substrate-binding protein